MPGEMVIHHDQRDEDYDWGDDNGFVLEEITRLAEPIKLHDADEKLRILRERHDRTVEWLRCQLLANGVAEIYSYRDGSHITVITMDRHEVWDMGDKHIKDMVERFPELSPTHQYRLWTNSETLARLTRKDPIDYGHTGSSEIIKSSVLPDNVSLFINDQVSGQSSGQMRHMPIGTFVLVPMLPPLMCFHSFDPLHAELYSDAGNYFLKLTEQMTMWQPDNTAPVHAYRFNMEDR
jgi:hypothetical protein